MRRTRAPVPNKARQFDLAIHAILAHQQMAPSSKLIAVTIAHSNRLNPQRITLAKLCKRTHLTNKTVIAHLRSMEDLGILEITRVGGSTPSRYAIMIPDPYSA